MLSAREAATKAQELKLELGTSSSEKRNACLFAMRDAILKRSDEIVIANEVDIVAARIKGISESLIDRLMLDSKRIRDCGTALDELAAQADPLGELVEGRTIPGGIAMKQVRVPLGVVAMIYEARPNVTIDAAGIGIKTGNAMILRGGSLAKHTNSKLTEILQEAIASAGFSPFAVQSIDATDRSSAEELMSLTGLVDVLIPRGGAGLIASVVQNSKVPVIETGSGNCHVYVEKTANMEDAKKIILNAKTQRPSVCNAAETLLIDEDALTVLPEFALALVDAGVELVADAQAKSVLDAQGIKSGLASETDFATEFLDLKLSIGTVKGVDEAIAHINRFSTHHTEAILTSDINIANRFCDGVDSSTVFVNASTRFTDGGMFGLGAEIGISTQKLHARGPMGLKALTSTKYVLVGSGQVRS